MKAIDLIRELESKATVDPAKTCDTVKAGDTEKEIKKVGVTMFPTVNVLREVIEWGADMLVVHEPVYFENMDIITDNSVALAKREMIEKSGLVIYRDHDHMHAETPDGIAEGELYFLGLTGTMEKCTHRRPRIMTLDTPITALELAELVEEKLGVKNVRIAGERNKKATKLACCFGSVSPVLGLELFEKDGAELMICGETSEWKLCEYARDSAALGYNRAVLALGHAGSERDGMRLMAKKFAENHKDDFETKYFECGEVYSYVR